MRFPPVGSLARPPLWATLRRAHEHCQPWGQRTPQARGDLEGRRLPIVDSPRGERPPDRWRLTKEEATDDDRARGIAPVALAPRAGGNSPALPASALAACRSTPDRATGRRASSRRTRQRRWRPHRRLRIRRDQLIRRGRAKEPAVATNSTTTSTLSRDR